MSRPTRIEVDCSTGVETIIELTDAEIAQIEADRVAFEARKAEEETAALAEAQAAAEAKASAQAKLATLGLTADEIAALSK